MTVLIVAEAVFVTTIASALGIAAVDPEQLGVVRRDIAIVGALVVNALVLLMGIRWRRSLLAQLDEARLRIAREELKRPECSIKEIAERLGFSEASAFHRAFKRRFGLPPGQARH